MGAREPLTHAVARAALSGDVERVERELIAPASITEDRKAALWLFAFALADPDTRRRRAPAILGGQPADTATGGE